MGRKDRCRQATTSHWWPTPNAQAGLPGSMLWSFASRYRRSQSRSRSTRFMTSTADEPGAIRYHRMSTRHHVAWSFVPYGRLLHAVIRSTQVASEEIAISGSLDEPCSRNGPHDDRRLCWRARHAVVRRGCGLGRCTVPRFCDSAKSANQADALLETQYPVEPTTSFTCPRSLPACYRAPPRIRAAPWCSRPCPGSGCARRWNSRTSSRAVPGHR